MVIFCYAEAVVILVWGSIVKLLNCGPGFNSWGHTNVSTVSASFLAALFLVTRLYLTNYLFISDSRVPAQLAMLQHTDISFLYLVYLLILCQLALPA